jgi:arsenate reductase-like glutaredoxin family protein
MNIQIFGKSKCFDTKKAERYFKERGVKYQYIDIIKYGISKGEYNSVKSALGGISSFIDTRSDAYEKLYIKYLAGEAAVEEKLLANPALFITPIVRNGRSATVGFQPEVWAEWAAKG